MRIALVIERMLPTRGGRERSVAEIAAELARRGHDVTVLCQRGRDGIPGVRVAALGEAGLTRARRLKRFVRDVQASARREGYDIVHAMLAVPGCNVYQPRGGTIPGQRDARVRMVCCPACRAWTRLTFPLNRARSLLGRYERQLAADPSVACVALSRVVAGEFARYYHRRDNVSVVFNGVAVPQADAPARANWRADWRKRWSAGDGTCVFLTVANNFALKGVPETVSAFADFLRAGGPERRDARLVVVGSDCPGLAERAAARDSAGRIIFQPAVEDVFPLYSGADAVVLLSWHDACSRVVLEALRWGVPSLTTAFNGASALLADGAGVTVESPRDRAGIAAGLARLADAGQRAEMVRACDKAAAFASIGRQVDELLEVYSGVAARRGG